MKHTKDCPVCDGSGEINEDFKVFTGNASTSSCSRRARSRRACWRCQGSGEIGPVVTALYAPQVEPLALEAGLLHGT